jgi:hypothetical protein
MSTSQTDLETGESSPTMLADGCPDWASELISKILVLEVEAGTIKNPAEQSKTTSTGWSSAQLDDLTKVAERMDKDGLQDISEEVEAIFGRIARGLLGEGFQAEMIATMINARIPTGCRLAYCSAEEVRDALS